MFKKIKQFINQHKYKIFAGVCFATAGYLIYLQYQAKSQIKLSGFLTALRNNQIKEVVIEGSTIFFSSQTSEYFKTYAGNMIAYIFQEIKSSNVNLTINQQDNVLMPFMVLGLLPLALMHFSKEISSSHGLSQIDLKPKLYSESQNFNHYYGGQQIKQKLQEVILYLQNPEIFQKMGARMRRGILLYGPPGTGKTMLARIIANQAGVGFIKIVASQFEQMFVGVGAKRVRTLFQLARLNKNGCIIFIDQIDALGNRQNILNQNHGNSTINQFLSEMDGFQKTDRIVIIAATNRINGIDRAILRPGRFDIKIHVGLPNQQEREGILSKIIQNKIVNSNINAATIKQISKSTVNWSGADLQNLVNESIYLAIRQKCNFVESKHLLDSYAQLIK